MKFINGFDRNQAVLFPVTIEQSIGQDNEVRSIDLFVGSLPLEEYGFKTEKAFSAANIRNLSTKTKKG